MWIYNNIILNYQRKCPSANQMKYYLINVSRQEKLAIIGQNYDGIGNVI